MLTRPRTDVWRGTDDLIARAHAWVRAVARSVEQADARLTGAAREGLTRIVRAGSTAVALGLRVGADGRDSTVESPGGRAVIFRKENRGESFQRQISNLRQHLQSEGEDQGTERPYPEGQETTPFPASQPAERDDLYAPSRPVDLSAAPTPMPGEAALAPRPSWPATDATTSVIAANAHWNGTLRSEGSLHVHGRADGELHATHDVFVAEGAQVDAEVFADNVVVAGIVRGRIEARGRLEVLPKGHVSGDVKAPRLVVHEGARLSGQLKMDTGGGTSTATVSSAGDSNRVSGKTRRTEA